MSSDVAPRDHQPAATEGVCLVPDRRLLTPSDHSIGRKASAGRRLFSCAPLSRTLMTSCS